MDDLIIIPTEESHISAISAIEAACFSTPWSADSFRYSVNSKDTQSCFTAVKNNDIVGYICLFHLFEEGELLNIATRPDMRKTGIAQKMIDKMIEVMKQRSVERITLEVRTSNIAARSLYEKNGFAPIAIRKNYYSSPLEDGIVMEKHI